MKKKIIIISSIGVGLTIAGIFIHKFIKNKNSYNPLNPDPKNGNEPKYNAHPIEVCKENDKFPLRKKAFHVCSYKNVLELQQILNAKRPTPVKEIKEDGKFGSKTEALLKMIYGVTTVDKALFDKEKLSLGSSFSVNDIILI
tara:strand:+ start:665 stop:1090 length:426 start_codon:yes stop_codon:yes gene_type:complete